LLINLLGDTIPSCRRWEHKEEHNYESQHNCTYPRQGNPFICHCALLAGLLAVTQPPRVLPYVVTTTANSGTGSLREAITLANNNPGADIITFTAATDGKPIFLVGTPGEDANASGDLDILDGGDLTIQGNGAANTIIDGGGIDRVFHVCPDGGCTNTVTLSGVTIRNGIEICANGGGIYNRGGTTTVTGSCILNNTAAIEGGGVFNDRDVAGATSVTGSNIVGNSAKSFFNNQPAQQIATGNWWGAATGPNTLGADTVGGGSVDTSGYLTEPILGCGPYVYLPLVLK
jgi:hypothetical protein